MSASPVKSGFDLNSGQYTVEESVIKHASVTWDKQGTPVSQEFDDVYFSSHDGLEETRYVFLAGNQLPQRFFTHSEALFIVGETGFGTGLNFLTLWQAFSRFCTENPQLPLQRLHVVSTEKFPLTVDDLATAHTRWPELSDYAQALREQWPLALAGCHRLLFEQGKITLDLWFGDAEQTFQHVDRSLHGQIDAWFLDGFAPARNPEMWTTELFHRLAVMASPDATLATFTSAGFVRRGLEQAGFSVTKRKGFGHKREMLTGKLITCGGSNQQPFTSADSYHDIAVIGGGIASALLALALLRRGKNVTLYCSDQAPALNASGNRQGAIYPLLHHDPALKDFFPLAFTFARRYYAALTVAFEHAWCGVTQLAWDEKSQNKIRRMLAQGWPEALAHFVSQTETEQMAGVATGCDGIHYPSGGWLAPAQLTSAIFEQAQQQGLRLCWQHKLVKLTQCDHAWQLDFAHGTNSRHQSVVLANGHTINHFIQSEKLPVYPVAGQVSHIPSLGKLAKLKQVLCYDGYLTPVSPVFATHCLGASYHRGEEHAVYRQADQEQNLARLQRSLPDCEWTEEIDISGREARCGIRCATRDHLPMAGALPDYEHILAQSSVQKTDASCLADEAAVWPGLFILGAFGSRGLSSAPLAAEVLAAQMCREPIPLNTRTLEALNPNRYWLRKLRKGKALS